MSLRSLPLALLLGLFIHLDWHLARHGHDGRSLGWDAHWLLAVPIFAFAAWRIARRWPPPDNPWRPAALSVALGILLGQVIEPLAEIIHYQATLAEELEPARLHRLRAVHSDGVGHDGADAVGSCAPAK